MPILPDKLRRLYCQCTIDEENDSLFVMTIVILKKLLGVQEVEFAAILLHIAILSL